MPIKVQCQSCNASFKAKEELAGRRVKCPKCKTPISIPKPVQKKPATAGVAANPLMDLLDEEDVRSVARGPICENCGVEITPGTIICVDCGFNLETGQKLETEAGEDNGFSSESSMTDAERIMQKAEREIEAMPVTSEEQDFGDGSESYIIAAVAIVMGIVLIAIGMIVILSMETLSKSINPAAISLIASIILYVAMGTWITIVGFKVSSLQGMACACTAFLWCAVFGFMQGKTMLLPTIVLLVTLVMAAATGTYVSYNGMGPIEPPGGG